MFQSVCSKDSVATDQAMAEGMVVATAVATEAVTEAATVADTEVAMALALTRPDSILRRSFNISPPILFLLLLY